MKKIQPYDIFESSVPTVGYHVSPRKTQAEIMSKGIVRKKQSKGVYVWDNLENARWFADLSADDDALDDKTHIIYEIDTTGLEMRRDPETANMRQWSSEFEEGEEGGGWIITADHIPVERISIKEIYP